MPLTRQRDVVFMRALNAIRMGAQHSSDIEHLLRFTRRALPKRNGVEPTKLFPTNIQASRRPHPPRFSVAG